MTILTICLVLSSGLSFSIAESNTSFAIENNSNQQPLSISEMQKLNEQLGFPFQDIRIDNEIDIQSDEKKRVILEFKKEPINVAIAGLQPKVKSFSTKMDAAITAVEEDHQEFKSQFLVTRDRSVSIKLSREYKFAFNGVAVEIPQNQIPKLIQSGLVKKVYADHDVKIEPPVEKLGEESSQASNEGLNQIGADRLHEQNVTGKGIKVGVLDSGVDYNHPDLKDAYKGGYDFIDDDDDPMETTYEEWKQSGMQEFRGSYSYYTSHGTHVSGTIAGQESNGNQGMSVKGVAPDVDLYAYRVLGPYGTGPTSGILAGIDRAVEDGMDIINLSLGSSINDPYNPLSVALNNATMAGTVAVTSAGNAGDKMYTLGTPAAAPLPISVGASSTPDDKLAPFSSRGPSLDTYDIKPEVTAPGVKVYSTVPTYAVDTENTDYTYAYKRYSGTSMASPHVAGAVALLLEKNPQLTPSEVKTLLMNTADPLNGDYSVYEIGAGRVNVYEAAQSDLMFTVHGTTNTVENDELVEISNDTGSLSFGGVIKNGKDIKKEKTISIKNNGSADKEYNVDVIYHQDRRNSKDATKNGVVLSVNNSIFIAGNEEVTIDASIMIPESAENGGYEGYIQISNKQDPTEKYQIPFGFRLLGEGITKPVLSSNIMTNDSRNHPFVENEMKITTQFLAPTIFSIQVIVKDAETNEELGLSGWYLPSTKEEGKDYEMTFKGFYNPFSKNEPKTLQVGKVKAKEGDYILEFQALSIYGERFTESAAFTIKNDIPSVKMNKNGGVYEVGEKGLKLNGKVAGTGLWTFENNRFGSITESTPHQSVDLMKNKTVKMELNLNGSEQFKKVNLLPVNETKNGIMWQPDYQYTIVKKGTPYAYMESETRHVTPGQSFKVNVNVNNKKELDSSTITFTHPQSMELEEITLHPKLVSKAKEQGLDLNLETMETKAEGDSNTVTVQITKESLNTLKFSNEMELLQVTFHPKETPFLKGPVEIELNRAMIQEELLPISETINVVPNTSTIDGKIISSFSWHNVKAEDLEQLADRVMAYDEDGNIYKAEIIPVGFFGQGNYVIRNLPRNKKSFTVEIDIPGHFKSVQDMDNMNDEEGKLIYGDYYNAGINLLIGGDVNGNNVIDVMDAILIKEHWQSSYRDADINFDGIVDESDVRRLVNHYGMKNPWIEDSPEPVLEHEGQTLETILKELGLN